MIVLKLSTTLGVSARLSENPFTFQQSGHKNGPSPAHNPLLEPRGYCPDHSETAQKPPLGIKTRNEWVASQSMNSMVYVRDIPHLDNRMVRFQSLDFTLDPGLLRVFYENI